MAKLSSTWIPLQLVEHARALSAQINRRPASAFPRGATGTAQDRRDAIRTGSDLQEAKRLAFTILRANHDAVIKLADKLDSDGYHLGPPRAE